MTRSAETDMATPGTLRLGTRGSPLALWQATWIADRLREVHPGLVVQLVEIRTRGDRDRNTPFAQLPGGTGIFTKEIQRALIDRQVDLAVHSMKDLPTDGPPELIVAAVPPREEVADALIAPNHGLLHDLPPHATVGTGSLRRQAQLLFLRPDLIVLPVRGNVETRLAKTQSAELDAVVLASAGLKRLGLLHRATHILSPPSFLPAVGQGALAVECRADDLHTQNLLQPLNDPHSHAAVLAERQALAMLEGGCMIPLAAWGRAVDHILMLDVAVFSPDGKERLLASRSGPLDQPEQLGLSVAEELLQMGAQRLLRQPPPPPTPQPPS